ncbi:MAG: DMT family transporter [Bacteroidales bacterium]|nr:DMT family transporter [Bacteroidales bacterium]MBQ3984654.1 DMT family transporter [Bacteroidales bacterium]MBQ5416227.1 DMT family transporter [Bacteroidales bacterium]MBQ7072165.1 DMT family transporter [Bacteroidales bacterium]MBR4001156.1 DMT family transporter [Bacteroidales bacterium]
MQHLGEIISLIVALSWTATAIFADIASHRLGALPLNLIRMGFSIVFLSVLLVIVTGSPIPLYADGATYFWLALSGLVGYVFGDMCLFSCYVLIGSKFGQILMTLAPPVAGIAGWLMLGEKLSWHSWLAMLVTLTGIAICILGRGGATHKLEIKLPWKGVLLGIGAGIGQGVGLVLSKIGLENYAAALPDDVSRGVTFMMPFAGTLIRAVTGFLGFFLILAIMGKASQLRTAVNDRQGMKFAVLTTFFGPFLGVSLSLMAVQYANAGVASTLMALTPVLIIVPYSIINHQKISPKEILGAIITVTGAALFFLL